jgi:hypothetical protein
LIDFYIVNYFGFNNFAFMAFGFSRVLPQGGAYPQRQQGCSGSRRSAGDNKKSRYMQKTCNGSM